MKLSPNFSLAEFTASATAQSQGIANHPNVRQIAAMQLLCAEVLEPLRAQFGKPVRITSGYRSVKLCSLSAPPRLASTLPAKPRISKSRASTMSPWRASSATSCRSIS